MLTPPGNKLICGLQFSSFGCDIHFQDFEDLSSFRYKICKVSFRFRENILYIDYTCNVFFFSVFFSFSFFFFFFVQYSFILHFYSIEHQNILCIVVYVYLFYTNIGVENPQ